MVSVLIEDEGVSLCVYIVNGLQRIHIVEKPNDRNFV